MNTSVATLPAVDWFAVERDYRAGLLSLREMSTLHGVSHVAIKKHADKAGWVRDLKAKIQARADELVNRSALVNKKGAPTKYTGTDERDVIEANSHRIAQVRSEHRQDITHTKNLFYTLLREVQDATDHKDLATELMELIDSAGNKSGEEDESSLNSRMRQTFDRIMSSPSRIGAAKQLTEMLEKLIKMEREAYSIDSIPAGGDGQSGGLITLLLEMKRSSLPIVHEVPRDDNL